MDLANPWILIPSKRLQNCVSAEDIKIDLKTIFNNLSHHPVKSDGHTHRGHGHMFLVCDVTWLRNQRVMRLGRRGVL